MKIGILTSGGDCPGLNAVIRGAVLKGIAIHGHEFVGFLDGWRGVVEGDIIDIPRTMVRGIAKQGGTILGTSRTNPFENGGGPEVIKANMDRLGIDAIIAIGGEGTLAAAKRLTDAGLKIVGVPKTVDNDLDATDYTFGFDTAVQIATEAIDRLRTTGESHHRCMIAEVMGRHVGWIALHAGMASGAHAILIPEQKARIEQIAEWVHRPTTAAARRWSSSPRGSCPEARNPRTPSAAWTPSAVPASAASPTSWPPNWRPRPASKPAPPSWATSSAAASPRRSTASWPPAWAWPPSTPWWKALGHHGVAQRHRHRPRRLRGRARQPQDRPAEPLRRGRGPLRLDGSLTVRS